MTIQCPFCHHPASLDQAVAQANFACAECGRQFALVSDDAPEGTAELGRQTIGRFVLQEQLGSGQFGSVWRALDPQLDRMVAVKIPRRSELDFAEKEAFLREAKTAGQLRHPGIVSVHEVGQEADTLYIVSDLIEGCDLQTRLKNDPPSAAESSRICSSVAEALEYAHREGVVHRDLKPANILLNREGSPRIADFGLAKRESIDVTMTVKGRILGTPAYMSPEQARGDGHLADARSDVYSLGVVLYEMLTRRLPFDGTLIKLVDRIQTDEPKQPRAIDSTISRDLETICMKCLEKEPDRRYQSAAEFRDELQRHLEGKPILARPIPAWERAWRLTQRHKLPTALIAVVVLVIAIGAVTSRFFANTASDAQHTSRVSDAHTLVQRGDWDAALTALDAAIQDGSQDKLPLQLDRVRVMFALGNRTGARSALDELMQRDDLGEHRATALLLHGDWAMSEPSMEQEALQSVHQAIRLGTLSEADQAYAMGLVTDSSIKAREHFERAVELQGFHRAQVALATLLVLTGHVEDARFELALVEAKFPRDPAGRFLDAWVDHLNGDTEEADRKLGQLKGQLTEDDVQHLAEFLRLQGQVLTGLAKMSAFGEDLGFINSVNLLSAITQLGIKYGHSPALGRFGLNLPNLPWYQSSWNALFEGLTSHLMNNTDEGVKRLEEACAKHDDALLIHALAFLKFQQAKPFLMKEQYKQGLPLAVDAARGFQRASRSHSLAMNIPHAALVIASMLDALLLHAQQQSLDPELPARVPENHRRLCNSSRLKNSEIKKVAAFVVKLDSLDPDHVRPLLEEWEDRLPDDVPMLKFRAQLEVRAGNFAQAKRYAENALTKQPENVEMRQVLEAAQRGLRELSPPQ